MHTINGIDELVARSGEDLGPGDWFLVTQADVDTFADVTDDHQWIHIDPSRASQSAFGGTIAHGFLTLSLLTSLQRSVFKVDGITHGLNYGLNRVRFPAPVPVGSSVRARVTISDVERIEGGAQAVYTTVVESDSGSKPVCVAEFVIRYYGPTDLGHESAERA